jgi:Tol biopolymer transport system component
MNPWPPSGADVERWRRIEALCDGALGRAPGDRAAYLSAECGADEALRREVEALLAHERSAEHFLERPAEGVAARALGDTEEPDLVGTRLGDYDLVSRLGAGGMGVVYRGTDRRLGRDVAIKVLPPALELDEARLARFEREARLLAAVNHPNIAALYGFVEAEGLRALVLELVDGETLAAALEGGRFSLHRSLVVGAQIADALDHAHRRGITHRDLKPSNVMLTSGGVKLLDFGIGKWTPPAGQPPGPRLSSLTEDGAIVGTTHYMSPEQLEGRDIDARADLFSFGTVLFEMLAGRPAFDGPSQASIVAAILQGPTPRLPETAGVSAPRLDRVVAKCLAKDPDQRWQSARDLGDELRWIADEIAQSQAPDHGALHAWPKSTPMRARTTAVLVTVAVAAIATIAWVAWALRTEDGVAVSPAEVRFAVEPPPGVVVGANYFGLSAHGTQLVYHDGASSFGRGLFLRRFNRLETIALPGTSRGINPTFSPDGNEVVFLEVRAETPDGFAIHKIRTTGDAPPIVLADAAPNVTSFTWPIPDTIFFASDSNPIQRMSAEGGKPTPVTTLRTESEVDHHTPQLLPRGDALLFAVHAKGDRFSIAVQSLESGERKTLIESGFSPQYLPTGHLVFARGNTVFAVPFDAERLKVVGDPVPLIPQVAARPKSGYAGFQVSPAGVLAYRPQRSIARRVLTWVDRAGNETRLPVSEGGFDSPRVSPDGKHVAFAATAEGERQDIFTFEIASEHKTRVTDAGDNWAPLWTRDGSALVYATERDGESELVLRRLDDGALVRLGATSNEAFPVTFAADQRTLIVSERPPTDEWFLSRASAASPGRLEPLFLEGLAPRGASVSPDGGWIAYTENASLRVEVFVQSFPTTGGRRQVSVDGGRTPVWRRDGKELFYRSENRMFAVPVDTTHGLRFGKPTLLFERNHVITYLDYDVAPDGRFLMIKPDPDEGGPGKFNIVLNWAGELLRRVPVPR